jgi:tetratricopeptide (TPR) repeat protein
MYYIFLGNRNKLNNQDFIDGSQTTMRVIFIHSIIVLAVLGFQCTETRQQNANQLLERGDFLAARSGYERIVHPHPDDFAARYGLGMSWCAEAISKTELGLAVPLDWYPAIYHLTLASRIGTDPRVRASLAIVHFNLGACFKKTGDRDAAINRILQAIACDSTLIKAYNLLGALYHEQGDLDRAERCYLRTLILKPDYAMAHFNLGAVAWARKKYDVAAKHFLDALALEPDNLFFENWLAKARVFAGRQ